MLQEAIRLVIDDHVIPFAAVHLQQLLRIKRASELSGQVYLYSIKGVNIKEYNVR